jgi:hypothetical protein
MTAAASARASAFPLTSPAFSHDASTRKHSKTFVANVSKCAWDVPYTIHHSDMSSAALAPHSAACPRARAAQRVQGIGCRLIYSTRAVDKRSDGALPSTCSQLQDCTGQRRRQIRRRLRCTAHFTCSTRDTAGKTRLFEALLWTTSCQGNLQATDAAQTRAQS